VIWLKITTFLSIIQQLNPYRHYMVDPDLNGFEGWMDEKNDFHWIRNHLFS
jgi:hypothetical protein